MISDWRCHRLDQCITLSLGRGLVNGVMRICTQVMLNAGSVGDPRGVSGLRAPGPSIGGGGGGGRSGDKPSAARSR